MTPQQAYDKRYAHMSTPGTSFTWEHAPKRARMKPYAISMQLLRLWGRNCDRPSPETD